LEDFIGLLRAHGVTLVVDVRMMPRARRNPQFNSDTLPASLRQAGIGYVDLPGLGGLRRCRPDSPNAGWKNASFQGYADYIVGVAAGVGCRPSRFVRAARSARPWPVQ
jgi:uncharacterized protein (DUF488 family)